MKEVYENLFVGDEQDCRNVGEDWKVVHACKHPCHQEAVGYSKNPSQSHDEYLVSEREDDLYLNLVDMDNPLDPEFTDPIMEAALEFIEENISDNPVLVHCNMGLSRAPSLALLFLAKRTKKISDKNYRTAKSEFKEIYPSYKPGNGIRTYLKRHW